MYHSDLKVSVEMIVSEDEIDLYLSGDLPAATRTIMEEAMESDPNLRKEIHFQMDIVYCIKKYRHLQLKNRLNLIVISQD